MTPHCDWLVLCRRVIEDAQTRSLTLVDCLDQLAVPRLPCDFHGFAFAAYFSRDEDQQADRDGEDGAYEFRLVRLADAQDQRVVFKGDGEWPADVERMRVFVNFAVIQLDQPELLRYRMDWRRPKRRWTHGPAVPLRIEQLSLDQGEVRALNDLSNTDS